MAAHAAADDNMVLRAAQEGQTDVVNRLLEVPAVAANASL